MEHAEIEPENFGQIPPDAVFLIDQLVQLNLDKSVIQKIFLKFFGDIFAPEKRSVGIQCDGVDQSEMNFGEIEQQARFGLIIYMVDF